MICKLLTPISLFRIPYNQKITDFHIYSAAYSSKSDLASLRKKTGYSLSICKKALSESNSDVKAAEQWLKEQAQAQGWAKAQKLQGRNTTQGLLGVRIQGHTAAIVELNCETDFVARNKKFTSILESISAACLKYPSPENIDSFVKTEISSAGVGQLRTDEGSSLADLVALNIGQMGENMAIGAATIMHVKKDGGIKLAGLAHPSVEGGKGRLMYGRYTALMAYSHTDGSASIESEKLASQLCQHIIGMAPTSVRNDEDKENSLLHQPFLLDESLTVGEVATDAGLSILDFVRREVGRRE